MRLPAALLAVAALPLVPLACSSKSSGAGGGDDAGADTTEPTYDAAPPDPDAAVDAGGDAASGIDCSQDLASDGLYTHLACTGLYTDFASRTVATDIMPYAPALQLWSDGATKQRWLRLPPGTKIDTSNMDEWVFPNGTKVWKEFQLSGHRIETRLYHKGDDGQWRHATYQWTADESDAVRNDNGSRLDRPDDAGVPYQLPTPTECHNCHEGRKDRLLGLEAVNLSQPGAQGITLASLVAANLLTNPPPYTTLTFPEDSSGKAAAALQWLHVSCGPCHNRSGDASASNSNVRLLTYPSDLTGGDAGVTDGGPLPVTSLEAYTTTVGKLTGIDLPDGGGKYQVIAKGDPGSSLASYLSGRRVDANGTPNESQMPPIVSRLVDVNGHPKLDDWITQMP